MQNRIIVALSIAMLFLVAFGHPSVRHGRNDYMSFYAGAILNADVRLYSPVTVGLIQAPYIDSGHIRAFTRPPFYASMLAPLAWLSYHRGLILWQIFQLTCLGLSLYLMGASIQVIILSCWFLPVWSAMVASQDIGLVLLLYVTVIACLERKKDFAAGVLLSVATIKFQFLTVIPLLIIAKGLWRFAAGFIAGVLGLVGICNLIYGPEWFTRYARLLRMNEVGQSSERFMPSIWGLFHHHVWIYAVGCAVIYLLAWRAVRRSARVDAAFSVAIFAGIIISPHAYVYDLSLLILVFVPMIKCRAELLVPFVVLVTMSMLTLTISPFHLIGQILIIVIFALVVFADTVLAKSAVNAVGLGNCGKL